MPTLSPNWLILIGLCLNIIGAFLISIEAIGASEFIRSLNSDNKITAKFTEVGFISTINTTSIFVLIWIITFLILWLFEQRFNVVFDLIISPLGFFAWRLAIKVTDWLTSIIKLFAPPKKLYEKGLFFLIISLIWGSAWAFIFAILSLIAICSRFSGMTFMKLNQDINLSTGVPGSVLKGASLGNDIN